MLNEKQQQNPQGRRSLWWCLQVRCGVTGSRQVVILELALNGREWSGTVIDNEHFILHAAGPLGARPRSGCWPCRPPTPALLTGRPSDCAASAALLAPGTAFCSSRETARGRAASGEGPTARLRLQREARRMLARRGWGGGGVRGEACGGRGPIIKAQPSTSSTGEAKCNWCSLSPRLARAMRSKNCTPVCAGKGRESTQDAVRQWKLPGKRSKSESQSECDPTLQSS